VDTGFLVLISFFTRIPVGKRIAYDEEIFKKSLNLYSLMGAVIGIILFAISYISNIFEINLVKGLILTLSYVIITGGIHLDGAADSTDGLFSGRTGDRIFEIMSDSHIGAFGVLCLIFIVLSQLVLFSYIDMFACFLMPIAGRASVIIGSWNKKYAKKSLGMGTAFIESINSKVVLSNILILIMACIVAPNRIVLLISSVITLFSALLISKWIDNKIGGMTGDTCGFVTEITQIIFMVSVLFIEGLM